MKKLRCSIAWILCVCMTVNMGTASLAATFPEEETATIEITGEELQELLQEQTENLAGEESSAEGELAAQETKTEETVSEELESKEPETEKTKPEDIIEDVTGEFEKETETSAETAADEERSEDENLEEDLEDEDLEDEEIVNDLATDSDAELEEPEEELETDLATSSNALADELQEIKIQYEVIPQKATELTEDDLNERGKLIFDLLEKYLEELDATDTLAMKISLGEIFRYETEYDEEDGIYDEVQVSEAVSNIDEEWKAAFQEAADVFFEKYGEYLWFDHLVVMIVTKGVVEEDKNVIDWTMSCDIGIPTDLTFEEISAMLQALRLTLDSNGFVIEGGVLTDYIGAATAITIPSNVAEIGRQAFQNCTSITSVTIPGNVKTIGYYAFEGCSGLQALVLSDGITSIKTGAFQKCISLKNITVPRTVVDYGTDVFRECSGLYSAVVNTRVAEGMFRACTGLKNVNLTTRVNEIGAYGFYGCTGLSGIIIPASVTEIGSYAFKGCQGLRSIDLSNSLVVGIGYEAFQECTGLTEIEIPSTVAIIDGYAFDGCEGIKAINFKSNNVKIGSNAFNGCIGLRSLTLPGGTTFDGSSAFSNCTGLTSLVLQDGIAQIPSYTFSKCMSLQTVTLSNTLNKIGRYAFQYDSAIKRIEIPASCSVIDDYAFWYCGAMTTLTLHDGLSTIGSCAFESCSNLTEVTVPSSVSQIGSSAFSSCTALSKLMIKAQNINIGSSAFENCEAIKSLTLPGGTTMSGGLQFSGCSGMSTLVIQAGVTKIPDRAFLRCESLTNVTLPNTITTIGEYAFRGDTTLTEMEIPSSVTGLSYGAFMECTSLRSVALNPGITNIGSHAFAQCKSLQEIVLPSTVTRISEYAFSDCTGLVKAVIPASVVSIGNYAFQDDKLLTIHGYVGSTAETYARQMKISFADLGETVKAFVARLYKEVLGRTPDASGLSSWTNRLTSGEATGAAAAHSFVFSNEFKNKNYNDTRYIQTLYRALMGRSADTSGLNTWKERLGNGVSREYLFKSFVNSSEFTELCNDYGIFRGTVEVTQNRDKDYKVTSYVNRCYKLILNRNGDEAGLNSWTGQLLNKTQGGGNVVASFVNSKEFKNRKLSDAQTVEIIYQAMLNRSADAAGKQNWMTNLGYGVSPVYVVSGFSKSAEFNKLCVGYHITAGTVTLTQYRDRNMKVTQFVSRCYSEALGRRGDESGLNSWTERIIKKSHTPKQTANSFVFSTEAINKKLNNTEFIKMLYRLYMGREADSNGLNTWVNRINSGTSRQAAANSFADSKEFANIVASYGL